MFTGIVTHAGRIEAMTGADGGVRLRVACPELAGPGLLAGESIAVAGVCLTVTAFDRAGFSADVSGETLRLTTLGGLAPGAPVNLERALRAGDRLGGHLVSGHVDGVGALAAIDDDGLSRRYAFAVPAPLRRYLAVKGSVTVDGVSLTVNAVDGDGFAVNLVPHTLAHTTLGDLSVGDPVNLEVDQVARYVERLLAARDPS
jgi:riboflavin synthase